MISCVSRCLLVISVMMLDSACFLFSHPLTHFATLSQTIVVIVTFTSKLMNEADRRTHFNMQCTHTAAEAKKGTLQDTHTHTQNPL